MWTQRAGFTVLLVLALAIGTARGDDTRQPPAEDPDPSFLEFLGGVDGLADANPDYLAQANNGGPAPAPAKDPPKPAPAPPAPRSEEQ